MGLCTVFDIKGCQVKMIMCQEIFCKYPWWNWQFKMTPVECFMQQKLQNMAVAEK